MISDSVLALICIATPLWMVALSSFMVLVLISSEKIKQTRKEDNDGRN